MQASEQPSKDWSNLAKIVYKRTYARKINENGTDRLEDWKDTVERVVYGNIKDHNVSDEEVKRLLYFLQERKAGPGGRGLWYSGTEGHARLGGSGLNNCWFLTSADWNNFVLAQDLLMLGGGVGLSIEQKFTSKLPKIKKDVKIVHKLTKDADFIIPDSREGWCELTRRVLESFFVTGKSFSFSTICVRGQGEPIKGFGGSASGPIPLIKFIEKISNILTNRQGKHPRPIDCMDIICCTGEMVVAGNVRRSAIIVLGDPFDKEFLKSKRWDLGNIPNHRAFANLSVVVDDIEDVHPSFWKTYESGEPFGIINRTNIQKYGRMGELKKDTAIGVNPCIPGNSKLLTPYGIKILDEINIGDTIWSGIQWTKIINKWSTGIKPVFEYLTNAGRFIGTENHKVISKGNKIEVCETDSIDLSRGPDIHNSFFDPQIVMDGLIIGDGSWHKASKDLVLYIGANDFDYHESEISHLIKRKCGKKETGLSWKVFSTITEAELPLTYNRKIPDRFYFGSVLEKVSFLRGLFSANGSVLEEHGRITLKQSSRELIYRVQEMLSSLGIKSYLTGGGTIGKTIEFKNGTYECRPSSTLNITTDRKKFLKLIGFLQNYKVERLERICNKIPSIYSNNQDKINYNITEILPLGDMEVFDITVDCKEHTFWDAGLLVSNCAEATLEDGEGCNLQEIGMMNLTGPQEFIEAGRLMHRYGKRVAIEKYHNDKIQAVISRNLRIGTGITGCLGSPLFKPNILDDVYREIQIENVSYSKELNVPESIRTTVVKPSGTMSKCFDQMGYEGIHAGFSEYMIQRVRFASDDPLIPLLRNSGHHIEPVIKFDGTLDQGTLVADFYVKTPEGFPVADKDFDTWKQLDVLKMAQKHWADQSVSVTVYYKKEEIEQIKAWLKENLQYIKTISFLCHNDHGFIQAPKEAITQAKFEKLSKGIKPIDFSRIGEGRELDSMECQDGVCPIK